ncbi:terminase large subunit domain-containing protein [Neisseria meningitidis]|uniref:terminase large subunit domain-containing protein n=1 Tax=Neisseria meningitidis TaxID=487 RepID=UPI000BB5E072|nr:terminase family protein [Neisseria meningitidis]
MAGEMAVNSNIDPRLMARELFWQGWRISDIARHLGLNPAAVYSWKSRENWEGGSPLSRVAASAEMRLHVLIGQPKKSDADYKEMRQLFALVSGGRKADARQPDLNEATAVSSDGMPWDVPTIDKPPRERKERERAPKAEKPVPNSFTAEQVLRLQEIFREQMFDYQRVWLNQKVRFRNLLKSRQIGATFFFAREAFIDALTTGKNKVFLSASKAQAFQFKQYMVDMAQMVGAELKGADIRLANGAVLYFLGTNSRTAQGRHGDLYVDEYFWIPDFKELTRLAKPMASQKQYRITYFSTPSAVSHPAYGFWTGEQFNEGRDKSEHIRLDVSHEALAGGRACEDGQWRQIVTLDDAERMGCTLFDRNQLLLENSPAEFRQLFMCEFVEGGDNVFEFSALQKCAVDSWEAWSDFYKPFAARPVGDLPVWIGYDPADSGDAAAFVAVVPPRFAGDKFRIVERQMLRGDDFQSQAEFIRKAFERYNVRKVVIDKTGLGAAVFQLVQGFFPPVIGVNYSMQEKYLMVNKMHALMREGRVEWELDWKDFTAAFLSIRTEVTGSGRSVTYVSGRTKEMSHADVAWAALQVFYQEPLDGISGRGTVDVF